MKLLATVICLLFLATGASAQSFQAGSRWINQSGSLLTINSIGTNGAVAGTYINKKAGTGCIGAVMALNGWVEQNLISFSVRWQNAQVNCHSITAWTGYAAGGQIRTDWDLIYLAAGTGRPTHLTGMDTFRPAP